MSGNFAVNINQWIQQTRDKSDRFLRILCSDIAEQVVMGTPVDTGFARSQWQPAINGRDTGNAATASLAAAQLQWGDNFAMTNNCAYIRRLEYGWSQQAPNGWVRNTINDLPILVAAALRQAQRS